MAYTEKRLIQDLQKLYNNVGDTRLDTIKSIKTVASPNTYIKRFGSIDNAREEANVKRYNYNRKKYHKEIVKSKLRKMERNKKRVTTTKVQESDAPTLSTCDMGIDEARNKAGLILTHKEKNRSKVAMIEEIRKIDEKIVSEQLIDEKSDYSYNQYQHTFGEITKVLQLAQKESSISGRRSSELWKSMTGNANIDKALDSVDGYDESANFYVYRLTFSGEQYYIGGTNNIERRIQEKEYWPVDEDPIDIYVESFDKEEGVINRERELRYETAIEFDTNKVKGGRMKYNSDCSPK